jgi:predicted PurR-regulated permease PerM
VHLVDNPERQAAIKTELSNNLIPRMMEGGVDFMQSATTLLGYAFLTLFFSAFMLIEGQRFREKFTEAYGPRHPLLQSLDAIGRDVRAYVVAKTLISGLTALCVWLFLAACDVDFAGFWGLIAFPLNFIPTVGALIASLPPVVLVMIDPHTSLLGAVGVTAGLFAVNGVIGSYVDPRFVGRQVKLSPLVVFLSMVFWGLLWGPMGMILAVPIMVSVKVVCSHVPGLEPVAILMKA